MKSVPATRGNTPNSPFLNSAVHVVPSRKSKTGTSRKNSMACSNRMMTMPTVVNKETTAQAPSDHAIIRSRSCRLAEPRSRPSSR
jgi:hypothetical protein